MRACVREIVRLSLGMCVNAHLCVRVNARYCRRECTLMFHASMRVRDCARVNCRARDCA